MERHEQVSALELFRDGEYKVIMATTVAEEGLDIKECNLVVRYDYAGSPVAMMQARGTSSLLFDKRRYVEIRFVEMNEHSFYTLNATYFIMHKNIPHLMTDQSKFGVEHYEVTIMARTWSKPIKLEGLNDRFDHTRPYKDHLMVTDYGCDSFLVILGPRWKIKFILINMIPSESVTCILFILYMYMYAINNNNIFLLVFDVRRPRSC